MKEVMFGCAEADITPTYPVRTLGFSREDEWSQEMCIRDRECRLDACDTVFFLDYPLEICLEGAKARIGTVREDMPWVETEFDEEFRQWILDFPKDQIPVIYELLKKYETEKEIIVFKSRDEAEKFAYI